MPNTLLGQGRENIGKRLQGSRVEPLYQSSFWADWRKKWRRLHLQEVRGFSQRLDVRISALVAPEFWANRRGDRREGCMHSQFVWGEAEHEFRKDGQLKASVFMAPHCHDWSWFENMTLFLQ